MEQHTGVSVVQTTSENINNLYKDKQLNVKALKYKKKLYPNQCLVLKHKSGTSQSALARVSPDGTTLYQIKTPTKVYGIESRNKEQAMLLSQLIDPRIALSIVTGIAGSGKTICAMAVALSQIMEQNTYKRLILTKPMDVVGKISLGAMPGDVKEKFDPYTINFKCNMEELAGENGRIYLESMEAKGVIKYIPLQLMRGASFKNSLIIADEVQVLDQHEMKTICTRIGEGSKLILMGDLTQRDRNIAIKDTGLYQLTQHEKILDSPLCSSIELLKCERSELAQLMTEVF
jgi:PhoH-like ATPase